MSALNSFNNLGDWQLAASTQSGSHTMFSNLRQDLVPHLYSSAEKLSLIPKVAAGASVGAATAGDLLVWEASTPDGDLTEDEIAQLQERVRLGANLLLSLRKLRARLRCG